MCTNSRMPRVYPTAIPLKEMKVPKAIKKYCKNCKTTHSATEFLCVLEESDSDFGLLARTFAFKKNQRNGEKLFEVMREHIGTSMMLVRNLYYMQMSGWHCWFPADNEVLDVDWRSIFVTDIPGVFIKVLNPEEITENLRFKYCGWQKGLDILDYLRAYADDPGVEFFGKAGIMPRKSLINKAKRDGNFRKYIRNVRREFGESVNWYGPQAILDAYKAHSYDVGKAFDIANEKRQLRKKVRDYGGNLVVKAGFSPETVWNYIETHIKKHNRNYGVYEDYLRACAYLKLDLKDTKNAFPNDFIRMHDLRIDQMRSKQAAEDRKKRAELCKNFEENCKSLQWCEIKRGVLCVILPSAPADLVREGEMLHHCVGTMGYDKKVADGRSMIAFVRSVDDKDKPFVTVEYDLKTKQLIQCYGEHDHRPPEEVLCFVEKWAEMVTKRLKAIEAEARKKAAEEEFEHALDPLTVKYKEVAAAV